MVLIWQSNFYDSNLRYFSSSSSSHSSPPSPSCPSSFRSFFPIGRVIPGNIRHLYFSSSDINYFLSGLLFLQRGCKFVDIKAQENRYFHTYHQTMETSHLSRSWVNCHTRVSGRGVCRLQNEYLDTLGINCTQARRRLHALSLCTFDFKLMTMFLLVPREMIIIYEILVRHSAHFKIWKSSHKCCNHDVQFNQSKAATEPRVSFQFNHQYKNQNQLTSCQYIVDCLFRMQPCTCSVVLPRRDRSSEWDQISHN